MSDISYEPVSPKKAAGCGLLFKDYLFSHFQGEDVEVPKRFRSAFNVCIMLEELYWDGDYHGVDANVRDCKCKASTHQNKVFPELFERLGK